MSVSGAKVPGAENSSAVPTASPMAIPSSAPRQRETGDMSCTAAAAAADSDAIEAAAVVAGTTHTKRMRYTTALCPGGRGERGLKSGLVSVHPPLGLGGCTERATRVLLDSCGGCGKADDAR